MSEPLTNAEAREALAAADRSAAALGKQTIAIRVAVAGFAAASLAGVLILGLAPMPGNMIGGLSFIFAAAIALAVIGANAKARPADFTRRYIVMMVVWAVVYMAALIIGMNLLPGVVAFWIPAAIVTALPGLWFVITGARR